MKYESTNNNLHSRSGCGVGGHLAARAIVRPAGQFGFDSEADNTFAHVNAGPVPGQPPMVPPGSAYSVNRQQTFPGYPTNTVGMNQNMDNAVGFYTNSANPPGYYYTNGNFPKGYYSNSLSTNGYGKGVTNWNNGNRRRHWWW
jgi:hypothetical protein